MTQLILLALLLLGILGIRRFLRQTRLSRYTAQQQTLIALGLLLILMLIFTGRLGMLIPLLGAVLAAVFAVVSRLLPLLIPLIIQYLPHWRRSQGLGRTATQTGPGESPTTSTIDTRHLRMRLQHDTGELNGEILLGLHSGRSLSELNLNELADLYQIYTHNDSESARLLEGYIERQYGDRWQDANARTHTESSQSHMDQSEALEILGLPPDASREDIIAAHRRLMQKVHPDRGGSDYLAAKINQAKDLLLDL